VKKVLMALEDPLLKLEDPLDLHGITLVLVTWLFDLKSGR
jgi:hypothetical protein